LLAATFNRNYMNIWNVSNKNHTRLRLWRDDNSTFRVIQDGDYAEILNNGSYILVAKKFAILLEQWPDQVTFKAVKVIDYQFSTESENYIELEIKNLIDPSLVKRLDGQGYKIWKYDSNIFVSEDLKIKLTKISYELFFSLGFSQFGGA